MAKTIVTTQPPKWEELRFELDSVQYDNLINLEPGRRITLVPNNAPHMTVSVERVELSNAYRRLTSSLRSTMYIVRGHDGNGRSNVFEHYTQTHRELLSGATDMVLGRKPVFRTVFMGVQRPTPIALNQLGWIS